MARPLRVQYPHALYHVIARGNGKRKIFLDERDRLKFLAWLKFVSETHHLICYAYCLMDNHFHLLIETPDANLAQIMRDLNGNYSQWFNARHNRVGHVFQGRYKSYVIEKDAYLLEVARYIVLNPVRAHLVQHPRLWKWSSYKATAGSVRVPDWLHVNWLLKTFADDRKKAMQKYQRFVMEGIGAQNLNDQVAHDLILGTPQFVHWIWENQTDGSEVIKEHPREQRIVGRPKLEEIFDKDMTKEERDLAIVFARLRCGYLTSEIAVFVGLDRSVVGKISRGRYNENLKSP